MSKLFKNISNKKNDDNSETCYYQKRISKENFRLTEVLVWKFYGSPYGRLIIVNISKSLQTSDCSHEIKSRLLLGRKAMSNLDSILKSRDITMLTTVRVVKAMVFPVVIYGCESWTIQVAECWKTDAFKLWCWRRVLRVPWTARRSNQSILKEINPEYSLKGLMLKLQYVGHPMQKADSLVNILRLG